MYLCEANKDYLKKKCILENGNEILYQILYPILIFAVRRTIHTVTAYSHTRKSL